MSTLERGEEIEADFYYLKSLEWAISPATAKALIEAKLEDISEAIRQSRGIINDNS